jgi:hypothetical protein
MARVTRGRANKKRLRMKSWAGVLLLSEEFSVAIVELGALTQFM